MPYCCYCKKTLSDSLFTPSALRHGRHRCAQCNRKLTQSNRKRHWLPYLLYRTKMAERRRGNRNLHWLTMQKLKQIVQEQFECRSIISGTSDPNHMLLLRFYRDRPLSETNCVYLTSTEARRHSHLKRPAKLYDEDSVFVKTRV